MKTINQSQLADILRSVKGAAPITISALVDARARKTGNPFKEVLKLSKVNGMTGANYEASVNRQHDREGTTPAFEARERSWGERISSALVENKGKLYLAIQPQRTAQPVYFGRNDKGVLMQVKKEAVAPFLPEKKSSAEAQGVDKEIVYRNYSLTSITALSIGGEKYRVRLNTPDENMAHAVKTVIKAVVGQSPKKPTDALDAAEDHEGLAQDSEWQHKD